MYLKTDVTGTDVWYYFICKREVWLNIHKISPDQEDENVEIGRFIHEYRYGREREEIAFDTIKMDRIKKEKDTWVVKEIKKSSKFLESSKFQLMYYLYKLKKGGVKARGELLFPEERRREVLELTEESIERLEEALDDIVRIANLPVPPPVNKIKFCYNCAYREYCWAEE